MEYGPDSEPNADVRFISSHISVCSPEENTFPSGHCSLVAATAKFGRVFVACGTKVKVFESKTLLEGGASSPLTTINIGAPVTHVATSCDGLTLLAIITHQQTLHALFYEVRYLMPGCGEQTPLVSVALGGSGSQVHAVAWNPMDPSSVAVAVSPSSLTLLTLKENKVEVKTENIAARALGWSPKGKQLTVGLEDATLKLFKPDLTAVRTVQRPPMNEAGAVLSIIWFSNTEFFIGYMSSVEEGAHVLMYVNAPKAKQPKFVAYDYVCNYNQGPQQPMFYPFFFPEWSLLCLLSSRAVALSVLGRPSAGGEGWCEYEIDEGCAAAVHNVSITQETFPLGLAVDFTSQKTFTAKDNKVSGPCPVLYTLSTGGELNIFHIVNEKSGSESLIKPLENLPTSGLRTPQQFGGVASYTVSKAAPPLFATASEIKTTFPIVPTPLTPSVLPATQKTESISFSIPTPPQTTSSISALQNLNSNFMMSQPQPSALTARLFTKTEPVSTPFFSVQGTPEETKPVSVAATVPKLPQVTPSQDFKFPSFPLTQLTTPAPASSSVAIPDIKPQPPVVAKPSEGGLSQPTAIPPKPPQAAVPELNDTLLSAIETAKTNFEKELKEHISIGDLPNQVGGQDEMGVLRCSFGDTAEWVEEMKSTTSELKGEVGQLHSEILEGFILAQEADIQVTKSKNPRHRLMLQRQTLDPQNRKQMEEIRSLYQYLQSQLAEIDTRLHLDWAAYRNEQNKKKKKELPASETLYQALKKCHYARKVCESRVDALCDQIKNLHLHSLSVLAFSQTHQEDDEMMATLEKSLRDTSISTPPPTSPFKMLSPGKQESLQKVLAMRNFIPLRKCSNLPRMNLSSLEDFSPGHSQESSPRSSLSISKGKSLVDSFGPQTFSTPMRSNQTAATPQAKSVSEDGAKQDSEAAATLSHEPQYEDITPPQTPNIKLIQGTKPASPLRALSRLVSEVPTTAASETSVAETTLLTESKPTLLGFGETVSSGSLRVPAAVTSGSIKGAFKPVTSAPVTKTTLAFSFTQSTPPTMTSQGTASQQTLSQTLGGGSSLFFRPPATLSDNISVSQSTSNETSQKTEVKSSLFFKSTAAVSEPFSQMPEKREPSITPQFKLSTGPTEDSSSGNGTVSVEDIIAAHLTSVAETESTSSSSSSSSAESDTASNITVIGESTSVAGTLNVPEESKQTTKRTVDTTLSKELSLTPSGSTPQVLSGNSAVFQWNSGSSNIFSGVSSSSGLGTTISGESSLGSSTLTTSTTIVTSTTTNSTNNLFGTLTTVSGGFFSPPMTTASGSIFSVPTTGSGIFFGTKGSASSVTTTAATTTVSSGSLFGGITTAVAGGSSFETATSTPGGSIFGGAKVSAGGTGLETLATSSGSIFGTSTTTSGSIFGTSYSSSGNIFGMSTATTGGIFGTTTTTTATATATTEVTTTASAAATSPVAATMFGSSGTPASSLAVLGTTTSAPLSTIIATTTTAAPSIFGTANVATTDTIFGTSTSPTSATTSGSIFGANTSSGIFGTTNTSGSLFGTTKPLTGSLFGAAATTAGSGSIFGSTATTTTSSSLDSTAQGSTTTYNLFGSAGGSGSTTSTLFGKDASISPSTTSISIITTAASTTISASSSPQVLTTGLFSSPPAGGSSSFNLSFSLGGTSGSTAAPTLFSTPATTSAAAVPFSPGGIFNTSSTPSTSAFTSPASSAPSLTPSTTTVATTASSVFGQATPGLVFGGAASQQTSVFGGGSQSTGTFGTPSSSGNLFGGSGGGQSLFGNTSSGSVFGQTSAASSSPFASVSTAKTESSLFGGSAAFGSGGGGGGGGFFSGLGSKPNAENANKNVFGTTSLSSAAPQTSLFGNNSSTTTSSPFQGSVFGGSSSSGATGGGFSGGGGGPVVNTGFGVSTPQSSAFGSNPTFGGSPSFGGSPTFGSSPAFGGSSTFASPLSQPSGGGFGTFGSSGSATFGSLAGSSSSGSTGGFGNFANQASSASFGSLAQQNPDQSSGGAFGTGGGSAFGSGNSFSAWR